MIPLNFLFGHYSLRPNAEVFPFDLYFDPGPRQGAIIVMNTIAISDYDVEDGSLPQNITTTMNRDRDRNNLKESEENNKKVRAPRPKLDFNRLLKGNRGLGYLAVCTRKSLKLSGKPGNEAQDLSQIVVYLQEWAKLVFPKMNLIEFLLKVEEICQSRIMKVQLKVNLYFKLTI